MTESPSKLPLLPVCLSSAAPALRTALEQEGVPHCDHEPQSPAGRFVLYDSRNQRTPRLAAGQLPVDVATLGADLPFDPVEALSDEHATTCCWQIGRLSVCEDVPRVNKRQVRRQWMVRLRRRLEALGGIWLCVSPYPFPYQSAFNLRIDHDQYDENDFATLMAAVEKHEDACSHYVCAAGFEQFPHVLNRLRGQHVGSHGYHHHTYHGTEENRLNIARGIEFLSARGLDPVGFVAPHGRFHRGLLAALEALDVTHSSEFGLVCDELPLFPRASNVLQLPVHPICLGLFLESAADADLQKTEAAQVAADYFSRLVSARYQRGEPVFVYGHPTARLGRYPNVLESIFDAADTCGALWRTTLSQFADWWRARRRVQLRVIEERDGGYSIRIEGTSGSYPLAAEYWRGDHVALMPLDEPLMQFVPEDLAYQTRRCSSTPALPVRIDRCHRLRAGLLRWLDWERVTPPDEIRADTLRGWMKRTLRKIKS